MGHFDNLNSLQQFLPGEVYFHGSSYHKGPWDTSSYVCCKLCKTKNPEGNKSHWAKGLCRSCYRRLSITHRLYNDQWNKFNLLVGEKRHPVGKKGYKTLNSIEFDDLDIETLLDRYGWRCAYSKIPLQCHNYKASDAFQLEYNLSDLNTPTLIPVCRKINCSKKGIEDEDKLKSWAKRSKITYPIRIITVQDYFNSLSEAAANTSEG
jgi:hypothetical protein